MTARVLVVDDDRDHAESIADLLGMRGHAVTVAYSGEAGLAMFRDSEFDITLMDVQLPGMNGVQTFFELNKVRPGARIMMMTGFSVEHLLAQVTEDGAGVLLHKPLAEGELLATFERVKPRGLIVVVDDGPEASVGLRSLLLRHGCSAQIARSEEHAKGIVAAAKVDCLILDLRAPVLPGLEAYMRLKKVGQVMRTILVAAHPGNDNLAATLPIAEWLLIKPFDPDELLRAIDAMARDKQS